MKDTYKILCINPGSTTTKLALFENMTKIDETNLEHPSEEISKYKDIIEQLPMRKAAIYDYLAKHNVKPEEIDAIAGRGCPAGKRYKAGAYAIDKDMYEACLVGKNAVHPMCLSPIIAYEWVKDFGIPAYVYDVVMIDEFTDVAHICSLPFITRPSSCHNLNARQIAREVAEANGTTYDAVNYIVCHLGGGCSVSMHSHGRVIDSVSNSEGTFTPSRAGKIPNGDLIRMCYSGKWTQKELNDLLQNNSGFVAHLGTNDAREVERRIEAGDEHAKLIYEAFAYNIAKDVGMMAVTVNGNVDNIILTGGCAYSKLLCDMVEERVKFIAPVVRRGGAKEMEALAAGLLRVIHGEETAHSFAND